MGIVARCCDAIAMSEEGRLGLSGPDVIEATKGVEELDAADRAPRVAHLRREAPLPPRRGRPARGGRPRRVPRRRAGAARSPAAARRSTRWSAEHARLARRLAELGSRDDAADLWRAAGARDTDRLPLLDADEFRTAVAGVRKGGAGGRRSCSTRLFPDGHAVREEGGLVLGAARAGRRARSR